MAIDFHSRRNRNAYRGRQADAGWPDTIRRIVEPAGQRVADIGCGGGIYSLAWHDAGAREVVGVDFSAEMVAGARAGSGPVGHFLLAGRRRRNRSAIGWRGYRL